MIGKAAPSLEWLNELKCFILRGVTDLVGLNGSLAYGNLDYFIRETGVIMRRLVAMLPNWLKLI